MNPKTLQNRFLAQIGDLSSFRKLLDVLPDVGFFMKDSQGRFMLNNRLMIHSKFPVYDKKGKAIGVVGFHRIVDGLRDTPRWHGRFAQVVAHIHMHYGQNLEVKKLAKLAGVSQSQFERRFNRIFGTTPYEYLQRVRITAARTLLETTDRTIADIACETGFYDHSHFTRTFKRMMSCSPKQYRDHHRQQSSRQA